MTILPHPSGKEVTRRDFLKLSLAGFLAASLPALKVPVPIPPSSLSAVLFTRARFAYQALLAKFSIPGGDLFNERLHPEEGPSTLWPYTGVVSAAIALARVDHSFQREAARLLEAFNPYFDPQSNPSGYAASIYGRQKYYDDNAWVGWAFMDAYRLFKEPAYLDKAAQAFCFVVSGWSDEMGGGVFWREGDTSTKNTCSNAPAAVLALLLYQETHEQAYLDWALRILSWLDRLKCPKTGLYFDNLQASGAIDQRFYSYNAGAPLYAYALLHQITGEAAHLERAHDLARAADKQFLQAGLPATPWFNAILLQGYLALAGIDPQPVRRYLSTFKSSLDHAWHSGQEATRLLNPNWTEDWPNSTQRPWLLDQAGAVECLARLAAFAAGSGEI